MYTESDDVEVPSPLPTYRVDVDVEGRKQRRNDLGWWGETSCYRVHDRRADSHLRPEILTVVDNWRRFSERQILVCSLFLAYLLMHLSLQKANLTLLS